MTRATARSAAVLTWVNAVGFGLPTAVVAVHLIQQGQLPSFLGLFATYAGPWSARFDTRTFVALLAAFAGVNAVSAWSGWLLWRGRRSGALLNLGWLPVEVVFWIGFALPLPWVVGAARVLLVVWAWPSLSAPVRRRDSGRDRQLARRR